MIKLSIPYTVTVTFPENELCKRISEVLDELNLSLDIKYPDVYGNYQKQVLEYKRQIDEYLVANGYDRHIEAYINAVYTCLEIENEFYDCYLRDRLKFDYSYFIRPFSDDSLFLKHSRYWIEFEDKHDYLVHKLKHPRVHEVLELDFNKRVS